MARKRTEIEPTFSLFEFSSLCPLYRELDHRILVKGWNILVLLNRFTVAKAVSGRGGPENCTSGEQKIGEALAALGVSGAPCMRIREVGFGRGRRRTIIRDTITKEDAGQRVFRILRDCG